MVVISRFESMLRHSYINLIIAGCGGDVCPVNDTACKTRAIERANRGSRKGIPLCLMSQWAVMMAQRSVSWWVYTYCTN